MSIFKESELRNKIKDGSKCLEDFRSLGKIYFEREDFYEYLVLLEKTLELSLTSIEKATTLSEKGEALDTLGKRKEAHSCFEQSLSLLTNEKETPEVLYVKGMNHYNLSLSYSNDERGDEHNNQAIEKFEVLLKKESDSELKCTATSYLAMLYCRKKEFSKSIKTYKKVIKMNKNNLYKVWDLGGLAYVYGEKGDYKNSEIIFKQALKIAENKKHYSKLYFDMGEMYFNSNRKREAIYAFNNALNYKEYTPNLNNNKEYVAEIYWYLGTLVYNYNYDFDKVIGHLSKTLEYFNEDHIYYSDSHITLGHCYLAKENYDKAKEHYNLVLSATVVTKKQKDMVNKCLKEIEKKRKDKGM